MFVNSVKWTESDAREAVAIIDAASAAIRKLTGIVEDDAYQGVLEDTTDQLLKLCMDALSRLGAIVVAGKPKKS